MLRSCPRARQQAGDCVAGLLRLEAFSTHRGENATAVESSNFVPVTVVALFACASAPVEAPEVGAEPPLPPRMRPPHP